MSEEKAIEVWQGLLNSKQTKLKYRNAFAGDGAGNVDVVGEPGYIWCRYSADQSKVSKVFSMVRGIPEDFPIQVGRRSPDDEFEQVLWIDWTQYQDIVSEDTVDNFNTSNHGESHNAASGADPAPIDLRNILEMRGRAQDVPDLTVTVERGQYIFGDTVKRYPSGIVDLTASVPAVAGHRFVLVYVNGATNLAETTDGTVVPLASAAPIPDLTTGTIPVCLVDLENGQTTIVEDDIYDWRFLWELVSSSGPTYIGTNAERLALTLADLAELTRFYTTDTDKIWEVWEGAWRLIYPPPALSDSAGNSGTPWATNASGVLTGSEDLVLDDGAGDSPVFKLRGGTNDDEVWFYLFDSGVATNSDGIIRLAGEDRNARLIFEDQDGDYRVQFTADGDFEQLVSDAATSTITTFQQVSHETTGTAAAGFGSQLLIRLEDAGGAMEDAAAISFEWEDASAASEDTLIRFWLRKAGVALGPFIEFGATEVVFNESSADIDFRIESDNFTYGIFLQGSDGHVGIGITPAQRFHVYDIVSFVARFEANNASAFSGFQTQADDAAITLNSQTFGGAFAGNQFGTARADTSSLFTTGSLMTLGTKGAHDLIIGTSDVERMRILSGGNIGIGEPSPDYTLDINGVIGVDDNAGDPGTIANKATFYGKDVGGTVEAFAQDEAGNAAQLTPHNYDGPVQPLPNTLHWSQYHQNVFLGVRKWYDLERALLALEELTTEQFIFTEQMDSLEKRDWYIEQARQGTKKPMPDWMKGE